jgi:hypothetical protein
MADASEKPCKKCGELKPLDSFHEYPASRGRKAYRDGSCRRCRQDKINSALGKFKDNVATLSRAQAYLEVNGAT